MHFCSKFGNCNFNWWWVMAWTTWKWGKFWLWSSISPWRSWSIVPQNNKALNQGLLHLWSKCGDPSLNGWWIITRTSSWLTDTRTHTHTQATTIPEGENWPRVKMHLKMSSGKWQTFCFSLIIIIYVVNFQFLLPDIFCEIQTLIYLGMKSVQLKTMIDWKQLHIF